MMTGRFGHDAINRQALATVDGGCDDERERIEPSAGKGRRQMRQDMTRATVIGLMMVLGWFTPQASAMLNPSQGRFMQRDPLGYVDGMSVYEYVGTDPANRVDPEGMMYCGGPKPVRLPPVYSPKSPIYKDRSSPTTTPGCSCGPDITDQLKAIRDQFRAKFLALPRADQEALVGERLSYSRGSAGWDIFELAFAKGTFTTAGCGQGACTGTVTVAGRCYPTEEANYFLWGALMNVAAEARYGSNPKDNGRWSGQYFRAGQNLVREYRTYYVVRGRSRALGVDYWGWGCNIDGRAAWTAAGYDNDFGKATENISEESCPPCKDKSKAPLKWHVGDGKTIGSNGAPLVLSGSVPGA